MQTNLLYKVNHISAKV